MSNYLHDNSFKGGIDSQEQSKYGALVFNADTTLAANFPVSSKPYLVLANGSAYNAPVTFANFANNLILRQNSGSNTATIRTALVPGPETESELGRRKRRELDGEQHAARHAARLATGPKQTLQVRRQWLRCA